MLADEIRYFEEHEQELSERYQGSAVLIKDGSVVGVYGDEIEASNAGIERFGQEEFLVRTVGKQQGSASLPAYCLGLLNANS